MGPAMRSARARNASASIRTTFSPMFFMEKRMLARAPTGEVHGASAVETLLLTSPYHVHGRTPACPLACACEVPFQKWSSVTDVAGGLEEDDVALCPNASRLFA